MHSFITFSKIWFVYDVVYRYRVFKFYVYKENEFNVHVYKELQFIKENWFSVYLQI